MTGAATEDIASKISGIRGATEETTRAMAQVFEVISEINQYQMTIASAVEEQSATTKEIQRSVEEAESRSKRIVGSLGDVSALGGSGRERASQVRGSAESLEALSDELKRVLSGFRFRTGGAHAGSSSSTISFS